MKDHAKLAHENFKRGYNCAQAVAIAFADELGVDEERAARLASSFGGGMGKMREVCGAVHGKSDPDDADAKKAHYARVQEFAARFKAEHETIICRELLKNIALKKENTSEPEARTDEYYRVRPCVRFVESAARILEEMLAE